MSEVFKPVVTTTAPVLDHIAQLVGKVLGVDAGVFWTYGRKWNHWDRWAWDYTCNDKQSRNYELRIGALEVSFSK